MNIQEATDSAGFRVIVCPKCGFEESQPAAGLYRNQWPFTKRSK